MDDSIVESLRKTLPGRVLTPDDDGYESAVELWNARFARRPGAIARCSRTDDVVTAVNVARKNDVLVAVRSGGHDYAGKSMCDGGLTIDLSLMTDVTVDAEARTARVQPGARWRQVDEETQKVGLATTGGTVSTVGVAGYTLGGGSGWLARKHGLAVDNLVSAEVVLASGEIVRASESENPDLFWALRGGSGNFGVVTSFQYRLHQLEGEVLAGQILYPFEEAPEVLRAWRSFMVEAPDELQCYPFLIRVPPLESFPQRYHGQVAIDLAVAYLGNATEGEGVLKPLRELGEPFFNAVGPQSYLNLQRAFDEGTVSGNRWYTKSHVLRELSDEAIETLLFHAKDLPGALTMVYLEEYGGAIGRVDEKATAFPHRKAPYSLHIFPGWQGASEDARNIEWARDFHQAMARYATGGAYVNLLEGDEDDSRRAAYGTNYEKLAQIKRKYDPTNLFRHNQNIEPTA